MQYIRAMQCIIDWLPMIYDTSKTISSKQWGAIISGEALIYFQNVSHSILRDSHEIIVNDSEL